MTMNQLQSPSEHWAALLPRLAHFLPAGLFNQLRNLPQDFNQIDKKEQRRIGRELVQVVRALEPLHRVLTQYMPRYLLDLNPTPGEPHGALLDGSYLFADVTGFTALTELLSRQEAARGREAMNQIMNRLFTAVLDPLTASGGDLLIFAGDAVLAHFPKQENDNDILQAVRAALRMQRAVKPFASFETEYGRCSLTISIGVESGVAYAGTVGTKHRMELLISGPGIHGATHAEESGDPGQVIVGEKAQPVVKAHFTLKGNHVIDDFGDTLGEYEIPQPRRKAGGSVFLSMDPAEVLEGVEAALRRVERLAPFLPEDMLAQMVNTDRHRKLESELRPVAMQFINIVGIEDLAVQYGPELATTVFQRYFVLAQEVINKHEGVISQIDAYSQGFFLLNTFGVPKAHEGTRRYAVSAALQMAKALEQVNREFELTPPLQQRGGITYGLIFSGEIGAQYRRESFVGGPAVNRAARLMSKAAFGQVILDSDIWAEIQGDFVGEHLPAVNLKGIDGPVVIVNVREVRRGTRLRPLERPLLGREEDQAILAEALSRLIASTGPRQDNAWLINGESGLGKTALITDLAMGARQQGITILAGRCQPHGKHIPLFPWVDLLSGWLDVDENADPIAQRQRLDSELASLNLTHLTGTLAKLLGLSKDVAAQPAASTPPVDQKPSLLSMLNNKLEATQPAEASAPPGGSMQALLQDRLAKDETASQTVWTRLEERVSGADVLLKLVRCLAERDPILIFLEDIHWIDSESTTLIQRVVEQNSQVPLMLVVTGHQVASIDRSQDSLTQGDGFTLKTLLPLSDGALTQIAGRSLGGQSLQDALAVWVAGRAGGNPLYVEALCQALQQSEAVFLDRDSGEVRWTGSVPALPLSLRELLLARFDELTLSQQDVLKWGAVLGNRFEVEGLLVLGQRRLEPTEIQLVLERVGQASFLNKIDDHTYQFNHPLMHETIYETLSFSQRRTWHTQIGDWLVSDRQEAPLELITHHYFRGEDVNKAVEFGIRAGDRARALGAYRGALEYYDEVLRIRKVPAEARKIVFEKMADVLALQGDYGAAKKFYAKAIDRDNLGAQAKYNLFCGDLNALSQTNIDSHLSLWIKGAHVWLLAQTGTHSEAVTLVEQSLSRAEGPVHTALEQLARKLSSGEPVPSYDNWLRYFVNGVLAEMQIEK